ncbi:MAG: DNA methyltransferase [Pseudomonadota bacterium]|nr:DNA methyltransferase [Pseudomonadota bacterium]
MNDFILWYAKDREVVRNNPLYLKRRKPVDDPKFNTLISSDGEMRRTAKLEEGQIEELLKNGWRWARVNYPLVSQDENERSKDFEWNGRSFFCGKNRHWTYDPDSDMVRLGNQGRLFDGGGKSLGGVVYWDDWPYSGISNLWEDLHGEPKPLYVVQTTYKAIQRCLLIATNPGDLILDPTCGSGTSAQVAEQWGRRWITTDTSRIALNIAKQRLMTATFPWYRLHDEQGSDIRQGLVYKIVPRVTLKSIANGEPPEEVTLYDDPEEDRKRLRVTGPFTVETLQSFEPLAPDEIERAGSRVDDAQRFEGRVFDHLQSAGVKNGLRGETAVFHRIDRLANPYLHAGGYWQAEDGERKAYIHIGPQFGAVSKQAVNEALKECRGRADADWLIVLGFAFESDIANETVSQRLGSFELTKVRMHDDLLQEGLLKKDKKAASFVTIGEPDIGLHVVDGQATLEVRGLDLYDPIHDQVKPREVADIAYWMVDDDYDGSNFITRQIFFCGGEKNAFAKWRTGLSNLASQSTKKRAEKTLRIELDDEAWTRLYGFRSHPIPIRTDRPHRAAVRVVSQFGEESTQVIDLRP